MFLSQFFNWDTIKTWNFECFYGVESILTIQIRLEYDEEVLWK